MCEDNSFGGKEDQDYAKANHVRQMVIFNVGILKQEEEKQ